MFFCLFFCFYLFSLFLLIEECLHIIFKAFKWMFWFVKSVSIETPLFPGLCVSSTCDLCLWLQCIEPRNTKVVFKVLLSTLILFLFWGVLLSSVYLGHSPCWCSLLCLHLVSWRSFTGHLYLTLREFIYHLGNHVVDAVFFVWNVLWTGALMP